MILSFVQVLFEKNPQGFMIILRRNELKDSSGLLKSKMIKDKWFSDDLKCESTKNNFYILYSFTEDIILLWKVLKVYGLNEILEWK